MNISSTRIYVICGIIVLGSAGLVAFRVLRVPAIQQAGVNKTEEVKQAPTSATLSGRMVAPEIAERVPIAVMIENHPDARPQSGLGSAEVVWEAEAEGGITRYVALFQDGNELVGPVRSARDYFATVANGFGGVYAHVGGSPEVLDQLSAGKYKKLVDVNEFYSADLFTRVTTRTAPHNAYAKLASIREAKARGAYVANAFTFSDQAVTTGESTREVRIDFSLPAFAVTFVYNTQTNSYDRYIAGKKDIDALTQKIVSPRTVIVEEVDVTEVAGDDKGRVDIQVTGTGEAYIFQSGMVTKGTWVRKAGEVAQYIDSTGKPVVLQPGQVWISAVSADKLNAVKWVPIQK